MKNHFEVNPGHEMAVYNITAVRATELAAAITRANGDYNDALAKLRIAAKARAATVKQMQQRGPFRAGTARVQAR